MKRALRKQNVLGCECVAPLQGMEPIATKNVAFFRAVPDPRGRRERRAVYGASVQLSQRTPRTLRLKASPRDVVVKPTVLLLQSIGFCKKGLL